MSTKLTPEMMHEISSKLSLGLYVTTVCDFVGISPSTFYAWKNRGEEEIERRLEGYPDDKEAQPYVNFAREIRRATAQSEVVAVGAFRKGFNGKDGWKAARDFLGRRYPAHWGNRQHVHHTGKIDHGADLAQAVEAQGPEAAQALVSAYTKALEGDE